MSDDGQTIAFLSSASNLVADDTNGVYDLFVWSATNGQLRRITHPDGTEFTNVVPRFGISGDGSTLALATREALAADDTNDDYDVYVTGPDSTGFERVSYATDGTPSPPGGGSGGSLFPLTMSHNGQVVAFETKAQLDPSDTNASFDVYVRDRGNATTILASDPTMLGHSYVPAVSGDGRWVAMLSQEPGVFVRDLHTGDLERANVNDAGQPGNGNPTTNSGNVAISDDGRHVVFSSTSDNLVSGDTNGHLDVFVRDRLNQTTERVSVGSDGTQGDGHSGPPGMSITSDGRYVSFMSEATTLSAEKTDTALELFVHDRQTGETRLLSVAHDGTRFDVVRAHGQQLADDGTTAVFWGKGVTADPAASDSLNVYRVPDAVPADTEAPVVTGLPDRSANAQGWYDAPVTIDWQVTDPEPSSGVVNTPAPTYADQEGVHTYSSGQACDGADNCARGSITLSIDTVAPEMGEATADESPVPVGSAVTVTASAADTTSGMARAEWWMDDEDPGAGQATPATVGAGTVSTVLADLPVGVHQVNLRSADHAGNWSAAAATYVVVYDPDGGFVTGGGWVVPGGPTSHSDDQLPGLDGSSRANFGFVVKYRNGSDTVPSGNLEFHYQAGNFKLRSSAYDWLAVTNSQGAHFQGVAQIDGQDGLWPFRIAARDAKTDRLSLKVYEPGTDPDSADPIYKASGDVGGGQILVHQ